MKSDAPNATIARQKLPSGPPNAVITKRRNRGKLQMLLSPGKNGLTSLFKVRVFKEGRHNAPTSPTLFRFPFNHGLGIPELAAKSWRCFEPACLCYFQGWREKMKQGNQHLATNEKTLAPTLQPEIITKLIRRHSCMQLQWDFNSVQTIGAL